MGSALGRKDPTLSPKGQVNNGTVHSTGQESLGAVSLSRQTQHKSKANEHILDESSQKKDHKYRQEPQKHMDE